MSRPKVLMTNSTIPQIGFDVLTQNHCDLITVEDSSRAAILRSVPGVDAIFWATKENLDKEILDAAGPQMKVVGTMSAGLNNIDINELKNRGIKLGNIRGCLNDAVADVVVLLMLATARRLQEARTKIEQNQWTPGLSWMLGLDVVGSTVGIVGLGEIGRTVVQRLKSFNVAKFVYTGHRESPEGKELGAVFVNLNTLLKESDFIIACVPLTPETKYMFNEDAFSKMKKTAIFVNVSRGEVVDQDALIGALKTNKIFGAGLDVMTPEPLPPNHELLKLPNVVLLPHLGSATKSTRDNMAELTSKNILRGLGGEEMFTPVC